MSTLTDEDKLIALNINIGEMEQQRDDEAKQFFEGTLSEQLIFRRVSGSSVNKKQFIDELKKSNLFLSRQSEEIDVKVLDDRALVTLIVHTTKADGTKAYYRNIRLFFKAANEEWILEFWYNYELASL